MTTILETKDLTYIYSKGTTYEVSAIKNINIQINKGELVGIIGHTGSGKSTLIQHFNGILAPTSGTVIFNNEDIWKKKSEIRNVRFKIGVCFQYPEYQLFEETVYKDIAFGPKNMKMPEEEIDKAVKEALNFVGLDESYLEKSPFDLSGGEKRRVAIAGVLAMKPEILVLDEPCAGLDPKGRDSLLKLICDYRSKTGSTVLFVSHSMEDISKISDRILVMNKSEVMYFDTVSNVFSHAEELKSVGLNIPQITSLFLELNKRGYNCRTDIYTIDDAKAEIMRLVNGGANV